MSIRYATNYEIVAVDAATNKQVKVIIERSGYADDLASCQQDRNVQEKYLRDIFDLEPRIQIVEHHIKDDVKE